MKTFFLAGLLVVAVSASLLEEAGNKFQVFKLEHSKTYKNQVEEATRFAIFKDNLRSIEEHNALFEQGLVSYQKNINKFSDMTQAEFKATLTAHSKPVINGTAYVKTGVEVPTSVDWRTSGQVGEIKNQGQCGSCWSFSLTGTIEAAYYRKHKTLVSLSEQQLVDCAIDSSYGCMGGWVALTMPYIEKNGLQSEASYPYTAKDGSCTYDASKVVTKVDNYVNIIKDESALLEAVATIGPVSVLMDATYLSSYSSGIFAEKKCTTSELNHAVLAVGYGTENGTDYWIVKNSWGASWGEKGYFKLLRGVNECGVSEDDVYPIIN